MKTPQLAFRVREERGAVTVTTVRVLERFDKTKTAYVAYGAGFTGRIHVPFAELASTHERASMRVIDALSRLHANAESLPVTAEKSAAVSALAGAVTG